MALFNSIKAIFTARPKAAKQSQATKDFKAKKLVCVTCGAPATHYVYVLSNRPIERISQPVCEYFSCTFPLMEKDN